jgi:DNA-binding transcriptional LysR family regulator
MPIDMELYRIFYTVANTKSISKAAEQLFVSQPAISKSIKKLEATLNISLFVRNSRGVKLTKEGEVLYGHVKTAMEELSIGLNVIEKMKHNKYGLVKMSASTILCKHILLPHLKTYINSNPHIKIQVFNRSTYETLKLVDQGIIDFGLVSLPFNNENYHFIKLIEIHDIFVACRSYIDSFDLNHSDIFSSGHPIMLLEEDNMTRKYIDQYMVLNNITIKPEIETGNMDILVEFAKLGLGITVLIKEFIQKELSAGDLIELPINPSITVRSAGIVYRKEIPLSIASNAFIQYLISSFRQVV